MPKWKPEIAAPVRRPVRPSSGASPAPDHRRTSTWSAPDLKKEKTPNESVAHSLARQARDRRRTCAGPSPELRRTCAGMLNFTRSLSHSGVGLLLPSPDLRRTSAGHPPDLRLTSKITPDRRAEAVFEDVYVQICC